MQNLFYVFISFVSLLGILSLITCYLKWFKKINFKRNWLIWFSGTLAIIFIICFYCLNNFNDIYTTFDQNNINILLLSYILIYFFVFLVFVIFVFYVPKLITKTIIIYKSNKKLLIKNVKSYLLFGTLTISILLLVYAFKDIKIVHVDSRFSELDSSENNLLKIFRVIFDIVNDVLKSSWVAWLIMGYIFICFIVIYLILKNKNNWLYQYGINFDSDKQNKFFFLLIPVFSFCSLVTNFVLRWESFLIRIAILIMMLSLFTLITFLITKIVNKRIDNLSGNFATNDFVSNVIVSMFFIGFLSLSSSKSFNWNKITNDINYWLSLYINGFIWSIVYIANKKNVALNRMYSTFSNVYVCSGVNTMPFVYLAYVINLFSKYNNVMIDQVIRKI